MEYTHDHNRNLLAFLEHKGWVLLENQTENDLIELIAILGNTILVTNVLVNPQGKAMVTSANGLGLQTDHHNAKYILWYCIEQTDKGGETILMDAEVIFNQLASNFQADLHKINLFEHKIFPDDKEFHPLVSTLDNGKRVFYYSFWLVNRNERENEALLSFQSFIHSSLPIKFKLKIKDILIIDNHRMLHGRTAIEGSTNRYLKRFWIQSHKTLNNT